MNYPSRSPAVATPTERGADIRPERTTPRVPESERHDIERCVVPETAERYPGFVFEKCRKCGANKQVLNPFERCPGGDGR